MNVQIFVHFQLAVKLNKTLLMSWTSYETVLFQ